ncbi:MAG: peptidylprolyl isomerase [Cystobacterineae bacterium]|nr:peptidylprolyl isomerase [Cystobacterineae bacterium]
MSICLLGCLLSFSTLAANRELVDAVAAVVNGEVIPLSAINKRLKQEAPPEVLAVAEKYKAAQKRMLSTLIDEKLMDAQVKILKLEGSEEEVNLAIEDILQQNNATLQQLEPLLAREGLSLLAYRSQLKTQLGRMKLVRLKLQSKVNVTEEDVKSAYEQWVKRESTEFEVHARHILIRLEGEADEKTAQAAWEKAYHIAQLAQKPEAHFAELAQQHGEGASASTGGDLGYFKRGIMVPEFENAAFSLEVGQVSPPIKTNLGLHIIKVENKRPLPLAPLEEMKESLRQKLVQEQMETHARHYAQELRAQAIVEEKL